MVSIGPYNQSYDYTHMYNFLKHPKSQVPSVDNKTIYGFLYQNPGFTLIKSLIDRASLQMIFNDPQANVTMFIPSDAHLSKVLTLEEINCMDMETARKLIQYNTVDGILDKDTVIYSSPLYYLYTRYYRTKISVRNDGGMTIINGCAIVVDFNIKLSNGIIHITDRILEPEVTL